jgi:hypothetical protein
MDGNHSLTDLKNKGKSNAKNQLITLKYEIFKVKV